MLIKLSSLTGGAGGDGCFSLVHSYSVTSANISVNQKSRKVDHLDYILVADSMDLAAASMA